MNIIRLKLLCTVIVVSLAASASADDAVLASWNDGPARRTILDFIERTTKADSAEFVAEPDRIAVFDNDGTLWSEQPIYFQFAFALDRVKALAPQHPEWKTTQPFQAALAGDFKALAQTGEKGIVELMTATHAGLTTDEFAEIVSDWLATARHPRFNRRYDELVFQPMLELLALLRANGYKTFIVSGGGIEFMRVFTQRVYAIPPEQVVGSSIKTKFELRDGRPVLLRLPEIDFVDDKAGKPVGIQKFIGRRPVAAFGNSDGDLEMLQWTTAGSGPRLGMIVHHTDADREWSYDRQSFVGRLKEALDEAPDRGWTLIDMRREWKVIYPFERPSQ